MTSKRRSHETSKTVPILDPNLLQLFTPRLPNSTPTIALDKLATFFDDLTEIGRGGSAWVYSAVDKRKARPVAVKILAPTNLNEEIWDLYHTETRALKHLKDFNHPAILRIISHGLIRSANKQPTKQPESAANEEPRGDGFPFLVTELVHAAPFQRVIKHDGPLSIDASIRIFHTLASALQTCHKASVIHGDFKSANVLYNPQTQVVKVIDFGLASKPTVPTNTEKPLRVVGTPMFMAPEQCPPYDKPFTSAVDIWGFGLTLYFALTGQLPFEVYSLQQLSALIDDGLTIVPPSQIRSDIPNSLSQLCLDALDLNPTSRPTAAELFRRLSEL